MVSVEVLQAIFRGELNFLEKLTSSHLFLD
jgi:hypothetical protein